MPHGPISQGLVALARQAKQIHSLIGKRCPPISTNESSRIILKLTNHISCTGWLYARLSTLRVRVVAMYITTASFSYAERTEKEWVSITLGASFYEARGVSTSGTRALGAAYSAFRRIYTVRKQDPASARVAVGGDQEIFYINNCAFMYTFCASSLRTANFINSSLPVLWKHVLTQFSGDILQRQSSPRPSIQRHGAANSDFFLLYCEGI